MNLWLGNGKQASCEQYQSSSIIKSSVRGFYEICYSHLLNHFRDTWSIVCSWKIEAAPTFPPVLFCSLSFIVLIFLVNPKSPLGSESKQGMHERHIQISFRQMQPCTPSILVDIVPKMTRRFRLLSFANRLQSWYFGSHDGSKIQSSIYRKHNMVIMVKWNHNAREPSACCYRSSTDLFGQECLPIAAACHAGCCQDLFGALRSLAHEGFVAWRAAMISNWHLRVQTITGIVTSVQIPNLLGVWPHILCSAGTILKYVHTFWGLTISDDIFIF